MKQILTVIAALAATSGLTGCDYIEERIALTNGTYELQVIKWGHVQHYAALGQYKGNQACFQAQLAQEREYQRQGVSIRIVGDLYTPPDAIALRCSRV